MLLVKVRQTLPVNLASNLYAIVTIAMIEIPSIFRYQSYQQESLISKNNPMQQLYEKQSDVAD